MNTMYYVGGISCAGKSTRVMILKLFLDNYYKAEDFFAKNSEKKKQIGYLYTLPKGKLLIIGKFITRNNKIAWQGVDSYTEFLQDGYGQTRLYEKLWKYAEDYSLVLDASLMLRSPYSRPLISVEHCPAKTRTWMFVASSVEEYAKRLSVRSTRRVTEDSGMWKSNKTFARHIEKHNEELKVIDPALRDRYVATEESIFAAPSIIGEEILKALDPDHVDDFKKFCEDNMQEILTVGAIE